MPYTDIPINKWLDFVNMISELPFRTWAFRGQANAAWPLSSSLYRYLSEYLPDSGDWERREEHSIKVFMRKAPDLFEHVPFMDQRFEWLGLMQHHGAPTRLLDFTFSPYVAAFFALEKATRQGEKLSAVWAINPEKMVNISGKELDTGSGTDTTLYYGEPFVLSKRLIAQQGTFVITNRLDTTIDEIVDEKSLVKFSLPTDEIRSDAMKALYRMNITQATLFPGLDGLARSMAYELEFRFDE